MSHTLLLSSLAEEILVSILRAFCASRRKSEVARLALVSRQFARLVRPLLHRSIAFSDAQERYREGAGPCRHLKSIVRSAPLLLRTLDEFPTVRASVRDVAIDYGYEYVAGDGHIEKESGVWVNPRDSLIRKILSVVESVETLLVVEGETFTDLQMTMCDLLVRNPLSRLKHLKLKCTVGSWVEFCERYSLQGLRSLSLRAGRPGCPSEPPTYMLERLVELILRYQHGEHGRGSLAHWIRHTPNVRRLILDIWRGQETQGNHDIARILYTLRESLRELIFHDYLLRGDEHSVEIPPALDLVDFRHISILDMHSRIYLPRIYFPPLYLPGNPGGYCLHMYYREFLFHLPPALVHLKLHFDRWDCCIVFPHEFIAAHNQA